MKRKKNMKLGWDTIRTTLQEFGLPPYVERAARWVERHPKTVLAGALIVTLTVLLAQTPAEQSTEADPYSGETPLFV